MLTKDEAEALLKYTIDLSRTVNVALVENETNLSAAAFSMARLCAGAMLAQIKIRLLDPILDEHPDLTPEEYER